MSRQTSCFSAPANLNSLIQGSQSLTVCAPHVVEADRGGFTTGELDKDGMGRLGHTRILPFGLSALGLPVCLGDLGWNHRAPQLPSPSCEQN